MKKVEVLWDIPINEEERKEWEITRPFPIKYTQVTEDTPEYALPLEWTWAGSKERDPEGNRKPRRRFGKELEEAMEAADELTLEIQKKAKELRKQENREREEIKVKQYQEKWGVRAAETFPAEPEEDEQEEEDAPIAAEPTEVHVGEEPDERAPEPTIEPPAQEPPKPSEQPHVQRMAPAQNQPWTDPMSAWKVRIPLRVKGLDAYRVGKRALNVNISEKWFQWLKLEADAREMSMASLLSLILGDFFEG